MINLEDLKKNNIEYDWRTIYVGIKEGFFDIEEAEKYAMERFENELSEEEFSICNKLLWKNYRDKIDLLNSLSEKLVFNIDTNSSIYKKEYRKLRYCAIKKLQLENTEKKELLNKIALLYDSIGYPEDMINIINYMPQKNKLSNEDSLLENLHTFIKDEEIAIKKD